MTTLATSLPLGRLDDSFSPILVKELRQGMRARVFILSFLLLQVSLVMFVLADVVAQDDRSALQAQGYYFWVIIDFALLVLTPLRGLTAISLEVRDRTMETILLTRLTSWRVVVGKWSALFAQSLLFVSAVLPYVVLRYFIGGEDLVSDFEWLFFILWLSALLIAASITISALGNVVFRIVMIIGLISFVSSGSGALFYPGALAGLGWETVGWLVLYGLFVPAVLFEITASGLAPASENHAFPRRFYALLFFLLSCALAWPDRGGAFTLVLPLVLLVGICYFDLAEKARVIPRMVQNFARWPLGRWLAFFFLPGWPSALLFSLIVIPVAMVLFYQLVTSRGVMPIILPILGIFGSILVPIFVCHLFWKKVSQVLVIAFFYNAGLLAIASFLQAESSLTHTNAAPILAFFPSLPGLMIAAENTGKSSDVTEWFLFGNSLVVGILLLVLLIQSRPYFRQVLAVTRADSPTGPAAADNVTSTTTGGKP